MEIINLNDVSKDSKEALLKELGYDTDGTYIYNEKSRKVKDKYTGEYVLMESLVLLGGSTVIINNDPYSLISYTEEYGEI